MTTQILPTRFQLSPAEVSTCFARLQRIPPPLPLFSGLPVAAPHLPEAVKDAPGQLSAEARTLFSILASPSALTTVRLLWPEVWLPLEMTVLSDAARSGVVLVAR